MRISKDAEKPRSSGKSPTSSVPVPIRSEFLASQQELGLKERQDRKAESLSPFSNRNDDIPFWSSAPHTEKEGEKMSESAGKAPATLTPSLAPAVSLLGTRRPSIHTDTRPPPLPPHAENPQKAPAGGSGLVLEKGSHWFGCPKLPSRKDTAPSTLRLALQWRKKEQRSTGGAGSYSYTLTTPGRLWGRPQRQQ